MKTERVILVSPSVFGRDAVGTALRHTYEALANKPQFVVEILCRRSEVDMPASRVDGVADLLLHPSFLAADVIIYFFSIYSPLFDAMLMGNGHARQIVRFHNVTPAEFLEPESEETIKKSFAQTINFAECDEIWCDSEENRRTLLTLGLNEKKIVVLPLSAARMDHAALAGKAHEKLELIYVGRFVRSKGVLRMLEEFSFAKKLISRPIRLRLVGNTNLSDPEYLAKIHEAIHVLDRGDVVEILDNVSDGTLSQLYGQCHILLSGSYHEGFGMPVIEALAAGCIPVTYANSNLRYIASGLGRAVEDDRQHALAEALVEVINGLDSAYLDWEAEVLPLDAGPMSLTTFDRATAGYSANFTFQAFSRRINDRLKN